MLAIVLFTLGLLNFNGVVLFSGWFLKVPWFHRVFTPVSLIIAPATYLYVRSVLLGELRFRKWDWILVLPTILYAINLIPYYSMPLEEKRLYLIQYYQNSNLQAAISEGFLPAYVFVVFRLGWSAFFIILNIRLVKRFEKLHDKQILVINKDLLKWIKVFIGLLIALLASAIISTIIVTTTKKNYYTSDLALGIYVIAICWQLFVRPQLLYGVFQPIAVFKQDIFNYSDTDTGTASLLNNTIGIQNRALPEEIEKSASELTISSEDSIRYKKIVESFFEQKQPYLLTDYSLEQLVLDVNIPRYILSAFINREYGIGFREYLNGFRVNYFKKNLNKPDWANLTLEAIALECGFNSRSTFIKNFKLISGQTPTEYIKSSIS